MSRGPGKIERAIEAIFDATRPEEAAFTVEELCERVYNVRAYRVAKKHRVAVVRAAKVLVRRGGNYDWQGYGGRGGALVLLRPDNVSAQATAEVKTWGVYKWARYQAQWLRGRIEAEDIKEGMSPNGRYWLRAELAKAVRAGDEVRATEIRAEQARKNAAARTFAIGLARGL
jgi:hypothetical protein